MNPLFVILQILLGFYLFAASSALTYLTLRSWLFFATRSKIRWMWRQSHLCHASRVIGFALITISTLVDVIYSSSTHFHNIHFDSLSRISGYIILFISTPPRLRRLPIVPLCLVMLLFGEATFILNSSGTLPSIVHEPLELLAGISMNAGITLLWRIYSRTVLRVRLTDKFTLAFSIISLLIAILSTVFVTMVIAYLGDIWGLEMGYVQHWADTIQHSLAIIFVTIITIAAIASYFIARRMMAPVDKMGDALRRIGSGDLDYRLQGIRSRDEMQDLSKEINQMARRLKEADAIRAEYVSFASHEIRNPLTAVKGFIDTLAVLDTPEGGGISQNERIEIYEIVREECDRLLRMTNELLENSRVEAGMPVLLNLQTFDIRRSLEKVAGVMRQHTKKHNISITGLTETLFIEADQDKFEQVVINLLSNAIKYAPDGGPIEIHIDDKDTSIELNVTDQGVGMTQEQSQHVFDKFYRIQSADGKGSGNKAPGTGIGLYLTRALVNAHGGTIRVKSTPGEGSTFTVTLPKKATLPVPEENPAALNKSEELIVKSEKIKV